MKRFLKKLICIFKAFLCWLKKLNSRQIDEKRLEEYKNKAREIAAKSGHPFL